MEHVPDPVTEAGKADAATIVMIVDGLVIRRLSDRSRAGGVPGHLNPVGLEAEELTDGRIGVLESKVRMDEASTLHVVTIIVLAWHVLEEPVAL